MPILTITDLILFENKFFCFHLYPRERFGQALMNNFAFSEEQLKLCGNLFYEEDDKVSRTIAWQMAELEE